MHIAIFISVAFVLLLAIRVVTHLGAIIVAIFAYRAMNEFIMRPIRLIRKIHSSPLLFFACFGAIFGGLQVLLNHQREGLVTLLFSRTLRNTSTGPPVDDSMDDSSRQLLCRWTEWMHISNSCDIQSDSFGSDGRRSQRTLHDHCCLPDPSAPLD